MDGGRWIKIQIEARLCESLYVDVSRFTLYLEEEADLEGEKIALPSKRRDVHARGAGSRHRRPKRPKRNVQFGSSDEYVRSPSADAFVPVALNAGYPQPGPNAPNSPIAQIAAGNRAAQTTRATCEKAYIIRLLRPLLNVSVPGLLSSSALHTWRAEAQLAPRVVHSVSLEPFGPCAAQFRHVRLFESTAKAALSGVYLYDTQYREFYLSMSLHFPYTVPFSYMAPFPNPPPSPHSHAPTSCTTLHLFVFKQAAFTHSKSIERKSISSRKGWQNLHLFDWKISIVQFAFSSKK